MTIIRRSPGSLHRPLGSYSHSICVPAGSDLLFVSGQVGVGRDGQVLRGAQGQSRQALANLIACLEAAGLSGRDVVRLTVYLTDARYIPHMSAERSAVFGRGELPTSTLLVVTALAQPGLLVEIDAIAARQR